MPAAPTILSTLSDDERATFGHFMAHMRELQAAATRTAVDLIVTHRELSELFGVCRETVVNWFLKAYASGNIVPTFRSETDPATGTRRRLANRYVVAMSATARLMFKEQWRLARERVEGVVTVAKITLAMRAVAAKAAVARIKSAAMRKRLSGLFSSAPPYVEHVPQPVTEPHDVICSGAAKGTDTPTTTAKAAWSCVRCETLNAKATYRCHRCKADRPAPPLTDAQVVDQLKSLRQRMADPVEGF